MKKTVILFVLLSCLFLLLPSVYACTCLTAEVKEGDEGYVSPEVIARYYRTDFDGAIFSGKIRNIEEVRVKQVDSPGLKIMKKVTATVNEYWSGVDNPVMTFYTDAGEGRCGVDFEVGKTYFVELQLRNNLLQTLYCTDYVTEGTPKFESQRKSFIEIFGAGKKFKSR
jgi:hypothetical protein